MPFSNRDAGEIVRHQHPLTLPGSTSVLEGCRQMCHRRVGAVLVTGRDGGLIGIFTGRDALSRVLAEGRDAATTALEAVMTKAPDTLAPDHKAIDVLRRMRDGGFRHMPIVDHDRIVGIVSRGDMRGLEQARLDEETGLWERI